MPSPKSGSAGSAVSPDDPKVPHEADKADPGEVEKVKAEQRQTKTGKYGSVPSIPHKPGKEEAGSEKKKSWIEIELLTKKGKPVSGEPYKVTLPDGATVAEGTLDERGFARVEGIDPGTCKVTFPKLDKKTWNRK